MACVQDPCSVLKPCILVYNYWAFIVWIDYKSFSLVVFSLFMARLAIVRGSLCFCLVGLSVHQRGQVCFHLKTRIRGLRRFEISTFVRACMRHAWSRVLVRSTWNLFRSTIYELKLCTSYLLSACTPPSELSEHSPTQHFSDWTDFCNVFL